MQPEGVYLPGPPGYPWLRLPDPVRFTLTAEVEPRGLFGLREEGAIVRPCPPGGLTEEQLNVDSVREGKLGSLLPDVRFHFQTSEFGIMFEVDGNSIVLSGTGMQPRMVFGQLRTALERLLTGLAVEIGTPVRATITKFSRDDGITYPLPESAVFAASLYSFDNLTLALERCVASLNDVDPTLSRATHYYACGCRYLDVWEQFVRSRAGVGRLIPEEFEDSIWATTFLSFYKAITVILEEPSNRAAKDRTFRGRAKALRLTSEEIRLVRALKEVRDDFDVAHRASDPLAHPLPRRNVGVAQELAQRVLRAYRERLREAKPAFGPHPLRISRRRNQKRSSLRMLRNPQPREASRFVVEVEQPSLSRFQEVFRYFGRDIVRWTIPMKPREQNDS